MEAARRAGTLVHMLEDFELEPLPMHIVYAERKPEPLKLRAFLDWVTPRLKARLASPATIPKTKKSLPEKGRDSCSY
jgi:DNA-binding transcriptional LysR family regulator